MHVYGTITPTVAALSNRELKRIGWVRVTVIILSILICLSTLFIKQHSVLDLFGGIALYIPVYRLVYKRGRRWKLWTWPAKPFRKSTK
jgi:membrane-associated phospholipid phosphatase